jgi:hypothetical protein
LTAGCSLFRRWTAILPAALRRAGAPVDAVARKAAGAMRSSCGALERRASTRVADAKSGRNALPWT